MNRLPGRTAIVTGDAFAGRPWSRQVDWITCRRPIQLYRPEGR